MILAYYANSPANILLSDKLNFSDTSFFQCHGKKSFILVAYIHLTHFSFSFNDQQSLMNILSLGSCY